MGSLLSPRLHLLLQLCRRQSAESAHWTLRFAPPLKGLGSVFSSLPALGQAGRSPGRFRGALHFGKEKGEGQHLHPAVPCQGHQRAAGCSPQFLLQNGSALPSCPLPALLSRLRSELPEHPWRAGPWVGQRGYSREQADSASSSRGFSSNDKGGTTNPDVQSQSVGWCAFS